MIAFPTLIFYEITFNLSTMLQAASRSYRLNQEQAECEVIYLFYEGTMEHTAVQLMSRKQRAAKILTGDTGLTGLDALTEGEGGFEAALLNAITETDDLIDPRDLFTQDAVDDEITSEDNAFWNVEVDEEDDANQILRTFDPATLEEDTLLQTTPVLVPSVTAKNDQKQPVVASNTAPSTSAQQHLATLIVSDDELNDILSGIETWNTRPANADNQDDLVTFAIDELGAVIHNDNEATVDEILPTQPVNPITPPEYTQQWHFVAQYLEQFPNRAARDKWLIELLALIRDGVWDDKEEVKKVAGITEDTFLASPAMQKSLHSTVRSHLRKRKLVSYEDASDAAKRVIELSLMALGMIPIQLDVFAALRVNQKKTVARRIEQKGMLPVKAPASRKRKKRGKIDLMAVPDDTPADAERETKQTASESEDTLKQLAFF